VTRFVQQPGYEGAEFTDLSMASATFREVDLSGARMHGVLLFNADIDGAIDGLRVNGVEVMPLIEAELDRLHPERLRLRPATPEAMRDAVDVIEELWHATVRRASALPEEAAYRSVNGEWSLAQTLRHAIFVVDAWYGHAAALRPNPFHPIGVPASFSGLSRSCPDPRADDHAAGHVIGVSMACEVGQSVLMERGQHWGRRRLAGWYGCGRWGGSSG
jgi:hypothetical protein